MMMNLGKIREEIVGFGPEGQIHGILTTPVDSHPTDRPAILLANVGILHKVGPYRTYVDLARSLAHQGFAVLRFDHSGLGDSPNLSDTRSDVERSIFEAQTAMDFLTTKVGARSFVIIGNCSGADKAHYIAKAEARVVGCAFIDGYAYRTKVYYLWHFTNKFFSLERWRYLFNRVLDKIKKIEHEIPPQDALEAYVKIPQREKAEQDIQAMVKRGAKLLYIYTSGIDYAFNYAGQFWDMYPSLKAKDKIQIEYYQRADHTLTMVKDRRMVMDRIGLWLKEAFPGSP